MQVAAGERADAGERLAREGLPIPPRPKGVAADGLARNTTRKNPSAAGMPNQEPYTHSTPVARSSSRMYRSSVSPGGSVTFGIA